MTSEFTTIQAQVHRYFTALYGDNYVYRAPEMFDNALERWMIMIGSGNLDAASRQMTEIEALIVRNRG